MSGAPELLLAHHLKALKLPTFLREYDKLARQCEAEGVDHPVYADLAPFDLVIANILSRPLIEMSAALCASTKTGGRIILSGMIDDQCAEVQAAYEKLGCRTLRHFSQSGWTALLLEKPWT